MEFFHLLVYFLFSLVSAERSIRMSDPAPEGYCYVAMYDTYIPNGSSVNNANGLCNRLECNYPQVVEEGCGLERIQEPDGNWCSSTTDFNLPYPQCCSASNCRKPGSN